MATLPEKTVVVNNPIGTAPGVRVDIEKTVLFACQVCQGRWKQFLMKQ